MERKPTFLDKLQMSPSELWSKYKVFLIVFGLLILILRFRDVIFDLLIKSSGRLIANSKKKSDQLQQDQNDANREANKLVEDAKKLGENKPLVDEDWHKK